MNFHTDLLRGTKGQSQQQRCSQIKYLRWQRNAINRSSYEFDKFLGYRHIDWPAGSNAHETL